MAPWVFVQGTSGVQLVESKILETVEDRAVWNGQNWKEKKPGYLFIYPCLHFSPCIKKISHWMAGKMGKKHMVCSTSIRLTFSCKYFVRRRWMIVLHLLVAEVEVWKIVVCGWTFCGTDNVLWNLWITIISANNVMIEYISHPYVSSCLASRKRSPRVVVAISTIRWKDPVFSAFFAVPVPDLVYVHWE